MVGEMQKVLCHKDWQQIVVDEKGNIAIVEPAPQYGLDFTCLKEMFYSCGYRIVRDYAAFDLAASFAGKSVAEFESELRRRAALRAVRRAEIKESKKQWAKHVEHMSDMVIKIDTVNMFETGFNVWLLLNSRYTFREQKEYVQRRHKDILKYIHVELRQTKRRAQKKVAELWAFIDLVSVTLTRENIVEYKFEIKDKIRSILEECGENT